MQNNYVNAFQDLLRGLNPSQKEAVGQIDGPVLTIAGPGTGKTHILAARIGQILLDTDTAPYNILCLTFTEAGVYAMRNRLLSFIGPAAHQVHIHTFHSFCNSVIRDNAEWFGHQDMEPLTDLESVEIIREIVDALDIDHPVRKHRHDPYFYERHLRNLFRRMKAENWTPGMISERIAEYLEDLPNRDDYKYSRVSGNNKKGDLKTGLLLEQKQRMLLLDGAASLFGAYQQALRRYRRYDYEDMILWVLHAFRENENLLRNYQERYLYYLVDEFQDTNSAQQEVLYELLNFWDNPNVFVVGDDDQAIYEFQGARLKNITDFFDKYRDYLTVITLTDNYRSSQHILNAADSLIQKNELRLARYIDDENVSKRLVAAGKHADIETPPNIVVYDSPSAEIADLVLQIKKWRDEGKPLSEIAIVYAKHKQSRLLIDVLDKADIPYFTRRRVNILELSMIKELVAILRYLQVETAKPYSGEEYIFEIMNYHSVGISVKDIGTLSLYRLRKDDPPYWRDLLADTVLLQQLPLKDPAPIIAFQATIADLLYAVRELSLPALIEKMINRMGLLKRSIDTAEGPWLVSVLSTFYNHALAETDRLPSLKIGGFLDRLDKMQRNNIPIEIERVINAEDGVNLLTAHGAKGLEFSAVYLYDCVGDSWEPSGANRYQFTLPDTITLSGETDEMEAARRLFYVAMTRAKQYLQISYAANDALGAPRQQAIFVDELLSDGQLKPEYRVVSNQDMMAIKLMTLTENKKPIAPRPDKKTLDSLIEKLTMSVTALNTYLHCPLEYYYQIVLKFPSGFSPAACYGIAVHNMLKSVFDKMQASKQKQFPREREIMDVFEREMEKQRRHFTPDIYNVYLENGFRLLPKYYISRIQEWEKNAITEKRFNHIQYNGVPLTGAIDKVVFRDGNTVHLVDYKTGSLDESKFAPFSKRSPNGGPYRRQLLFYKLLIENSNLSAFSVRSAEIDYLTPDGNGLFPIKSIELDNIEEQQAIRKLITETWAKIQQHDFFEGCGKKDCDWCNFVRNHVVPDSFSSEISDELDDRS